MFCTPGRLVTSPPHACSDDFRASKGSRESVVTFAFPFRVTYIPIRTPRATVLRSRFWAHYGHCRESLCSLIVTIQASASEAHFRNASSSSTPPICFHTSQLALDLGPLCSPSQCSIYSQQPKPHFGRLQGYHLVNRVFPRSLRPRDCRSLPEAC